MQRVRHAIILLSVVLCWGCQGNTPTVNVGTLPAVAPPIATFTTFAYLSQHPLMFDGRLVRVRAWLVFGWEGDNFLFDASARPDRNTADFPGSTIWLYCKPDYEPFVYGAMRPDARRVLATFTGYFHFVPDMESQIHGVFYAGPFQLEAIEVYPDPLSQLLNGSF